MFTCSSLILAFLFFLSVVLPTQNILRKKLSGLNYQIMLLSQFISISPAFFFNLPIVTQQSYQENFIEKINLAFQNLILIFSAIVSCLILFKFDVTSKNKEEKESQKRERLDWLYDCQCNVMLPIVSIIRNIPLFLAFNSVFFCIPIYTSLKGKSCRLNTFIKSLYLWLFNLGIIIMEIVKNEKDLQTFNTIALLVTLIIFVGTLYEILEIIINIVYRIFTLVFGSNRVAESP
jgi:hypothetical protein